MVDMKNHNIMMINIASSLNYPKFDEVKDFPTSHGMWNKLEKIYGGDNTMKRAKVESLRDQFDQMQMKANENIAKYNERIKTSVSEIKVVRG